MSYRTRKSVTPKPRSTDSPAKMSEPQSPPSPLLQDRNQERIKLSMLNDRLAGYIERVRNLESENSILQEQITVINTKSTTECKEIKELYEQELLEARKMIDELSNERAELQLNNSKFKSELDDAVKRAQRADDDKNNMGRTLEARQQQLADTLARLERLETSSAKMKQLENDLATMTKQLATGQRQLEEETLLRIKVQNEMHRVTEEARFRDELCRREHATFSSESFERRVQEITAEREEQLNAHLQEQLDDMRAEHEAALTRVRNEKEQLYMGKIDKLQQRLSGAESTYEQVKKRLRDAEHDADVERQRAQELETSLKRLKKDSMDDRERLTTEVDKLRNDLDRQMQDFQQLSEAKCSLDMELQAYQQLLDSEDTRLNESNQSFSTVKRRKRVLVSDKSSSFIHDTAHFDTTAHADGPLAIGEVDADGTFIEIVNHGEEDLNLGQFHLVKSAGVDSFDYKFSRSVTLPASTACRVYSAGTPGVKQSIPQTLVLKNGKWPARAGPGVTETQLVDNHGETIATCKEQRRLAKAARKSADGAPGQCVVM